MEFKIKKIEDIIKQELDRDEHIKWIGQPIIKRVILPSFGMFFFAIPWTAFSLFWIYGASGFKIPNYSDGFMIENLFPLFGIPFVLVGLAMSSSPYWAYKKAKKTIYAITNKRVIIVNGDIIFNTIYSRDLLKIDNIKIKKRDDGSGSIIFEERVIYTNKIKSIGFLEIENIKKVQTIIKEEQKN